jgi:hypothetical protein
LDVAIAFVFVVEGGLEALAADGSEAIFDVTECEFRVLFLDVTVSSW